MFVRVDPVTEGASPADGEAAAGDQHPGPLLRVLVTTLSTGHPGAMAQVLLTNDPGLCLQGKHDKSF